MFSTLRVSLDLSLVMCVQSTEFTPLVYSPSKNSFLVSDHYTCMIHQTGKKVVHCQRSSVQLAHYRSVLSLCLYM